MSAPLEVLSYGESLVDFLPDRAGVPLREVETFRKTIGGAPTNLAVGLARLGRRVGLVGKVGDDEFGHFLIDALGREGVDTRGVAKTREAKTGITFISLTDSGDRSFLFFREPSADMTLRASDIDREAIEPCRIFSVGSNLLTAPGVREATYTALEIARQAGALITVDPNIRLHLWGDAETTREQVSRLLGYADLVKLNDEELAFVGEGMSAAELYRQRLRPEGIAALVHTRAEAGAEVFAGDLHLRVEAPHGEVVDTTGAGDGFMAGLLTGICRLAEARNPDWSGPEARTMLRGMREDDWRRILQLGCFVGTSVCGALGATPALPQGADVPWTELGL